jgi:hypothetical protein
VEHGAALVKRESRSRKDSGEHSGTSADVKEPRRFEPAKSVLDFFEFGPERIQVDVDAQAGEVFICTFDASRVLGSPTLVVAPQRGAAW